MKRRTAFRLFAESVILCLLAALWIKTVRASYRMGAADAARPAYAAGLSVGSAEGFLKANAGHPVDCHRWVQMPQYEAVVCRIWRAR